MKTQSKTMNILEIDPPEYYLARLNRQIKDVMNSTLRKHGLTLVEWRLLQSLADQNSLTICDLAQFAVVDRTVASRLVEKLNERKLVRKIALAHDKRFVQVSITSKGKDLLALCHDPVAAVRNALFARISANEVDSFIDTLQVLLENAGNARRLRVQI